MIDNMLAAYAFLNELLNKDVDLFSLAGLHSMLELNHTVLCGSEPSMRYEYHHHILETRKRFHVNINKTRKWVLKHLNKVPPLRLATGFYCRMLSQPQLFFEGNHRTGNIILNYMLVCCSSAPYLVSAETAYDYLELSGRIKFLNKGKPGDKLLKWTSYEKAFQQFLSNAVSDQWMVA